MTITPDEEPRDPATQAEENYKDPEAPIAGAPNLRDLHDRITSERDESS